MEYWSVGVMQLSIREEFHIINHYSSTPALHCSNISVAIFTSAKRITFILDL